MAASGQKRALPRAYMPQVLEFVKFRVSSNQGRLDTYPFSNKEVLTMIMSPLRSIGIVQRVHPQRVQKRLCFSFPLDVFLIVQLPIISSPESTLTCSFLKTAVCLTSINMAVGYTTIWSITYDLKSTTSIQFTIATITSVHLLRLIFYLEIHALAHAGTMPCEVRHFLPFRRRIGVG